MIDGLLKLQKKIELERPVKKLFTDRTNNNEWIEGSGKLETQPNAAVDQYDPSVGVAADGEKG